MKTVITLLLALSAFALQAFARTPTTPGPLPVEARCVAIPEDVRGTTDDPRVWRLETLAASEEGDNAALCPTAAQSARRCVARS